MRSFSRTRLLKETRTTSLGALWSSIGSRPYLSSIEPVCKGGQPIFRFASSEVLLSRAKDACDHIVNLLGSGPTELGTKIDWHCDFKTGHRWASKYFRDIRYNNPELPSDVKVPWELSRMQWLIPVGQAYILTGEEHYAEKVRDLLLDWIADNPYAGSVNWSCTMEVALRIFTWTWFYSVFKDSPSWKDESFREKFLCSLFLHGVFTERYIERSDINGNHYTADAAGLVIAGLFWRTGAHAERWAHDGWKFLNEEIDMQVFEDGVDFEASIPYHRLITELFLYPAIYRLRAGCTVDKPYQEKLVKMGVFIATYTKPDGLAPLWGDADDARTLPFGVQGVNDHRYLVGIIGTLFNDERLLQYADGTTEEQWWLLGPTSLRLLPCAPELPPSAAFPLGGFYVMRGARDHIFVDCGPVGLAGRGGHGHNDCLSFEAVLDGIPLISDCGAYLYTASYTDRNAFRSTSYHNTPQIDEEEINRFLGPDYLWSLHNDAIPRAVEFSFTEASARFYGEHTGYLRLPQCVVPQRTISIDFLTHTLLIQDRFDGTGEVNLRLPLHLAPGVTARHKGETIILEAGGRRFEVCWEAQHLSSIEIEPGRISPSYGIVIPSLVLVWFFEGANCDEVRLSVRIRPLPVD